ncbi:Phenol acid carboxylase protein [Rutstroemia sp. NJR-2017a WRK4]|nr:Phenol acid carboxylase protein [Rutstroemia sp. NJR-2017a WRK4]
MPLQHSETNPAILSQWEKDLKDVHLLYDYDAKDENGKPEKWRYEMYFAHPTLIIYAIHGGPMAGRRNYQRCSYQCLRAGELWQVNWLEETGTICSLVYDIPQGKISTLIAFSQGHWEQAEQAHGDKRNAEDFQRWRGLARIGGQTDRVMLNEQGKVVELSRGRGGLGWVEEGVETM